ncbi:hypothetical protein P691DRAFT_754890 [Macrolepiota fuliginosa MF-IS2]|uniref:DUF6593 domain-containing protein n=1 Tax=Macrolepiota fuliginosa MF-IS2 TaxID=1400762 RepID=A0A9P6CAG4_9AGAR|nr:hypothetical protein P691DRAFT_754890 [Macrolepiota fuliginosa MF-IS2]
MIILNEIESLKSESSASLYLLEPPPKHPLSGTILSANSSSVSLSQRTPLPPSPPQRSLPQPTTPPGHVHFFTLAFAASTRQGLIDDSHNRYLESKRPATSITYTFTPKVTPSNSMILSAPTYTSAPQDPYYISVNMNCFTPTSYITTICRGSWEGETVGEFEMGLTVSKRQSTVYTRGREYSLSDLLETNFRLIKTTWSWNIMDEDRNVIHWDDSSGNGMLTCFSSKDRVRGDLLAKFIPPSHPRKHGKTPEFTRLEVLPLGHDFIDDIVISSLVIERWRTTPTIPHVSNPLT